MQHLSVQGRTSEGGGYIHKPVKLADFQVLTQKELFTPQKWMHKSKNKE